MKEGEQSIEEMVASFCPEDQLMFRLLSEAPDDFRYTDYYDFKKFVEGNPPIDEETERRNIAEFILNQRETKNHEDLSKRYNTPLVEKYAALNQDDPNIPRAWLKAMDGKTTVQERRDAILAFMAQEDQARENRKATLTLMDEADPDFPPELREYLVSNPYSLRHSKKGFEHQLSQKWVGVGDWLRSIRSSENDANRQKLMEDMGEN